MKYKLQIERFISGKDWTIGEFRLIDTSNNFPIFNGFSLEPAGADEVRSGMDKRIPQGIYNAVFEYSNKFKRFLPVLFNEKVSKTRRILIHVGNHGGNTEGCILLGNEWSNNFVYNSTATLATLFKYLKSEPFEVEIINRKDLK